jgi:cobalt-zinc-cadmium efflux system membrane fusion protein
VNIRRALFTRAAAPVAVLALAAACRGTPPSPAASPETAASHPTVVVLSDAALANSDITVEAVVTRERTGRLVAPGVIALDETRTARVGSLQEGLILATLAQVGDRVRPRQLLATMHSHAMHDAWAGYRKAVADRRRLEKELAYAVDAHERAGRLFAAKAISLQELQRAEVDRVAAGQLVEMAKAEVNRSIEELEHVGVSIATASEDDPGDPSDESREEIPVRSPIAGVVLERLVTPGTTVVPGTPLFVVSELSTLWAIAELDESRLSRIRPGRPVEISVAAYPGQTFSGTVTSIADVVNPKTRRITVRSTIPNRDGRLKPEMFATVSIGEGEPRAAVVVPPGAIQTIDGHPAVFVAEDHGRFTPRAVTLGAEQDGLVEIVEGLEPGRRIAVSGSFVLKSELLKASAGGQ